MSMEIPDQNLAYKLWFLPYWEDVSELEDTETKSALSLYWSLPGQDTGIHHRCETFKKFDPRDTSVEAIQAATTVMRDPINRLKFMAAITETIRGINDPAQP